MKKEPNAPGTFCSSVFASIAMAANSTSAATCVGSLATPSSSSPSPLATMQQARSNSGAIPIPMAVAVPAVVPVLATAATPPPTASTGSGVLGWLLSLSSAARTSLQLTPMVADNAFDLAQLATDSSMNVVQPAVRGTEQLLRGGLGITSGATVMALEQLAVMNTRDGERVEDSTWSSIASGVNAASSMIDAGIASTSRAIRETVLPAARYVAVGGINVGKTLTGSGMRAGSMAMDVVDHGVVRLLANIWGIDPMEVEQLREKDIFVVIGDVITIARELNKDMEHVPARELLQAIAAWGALQRAVHIADKDALAIKAATAKHHDHDDDDSKHDTKRHHHAHHHHHADDLWSKMVQEEKRAAMNQRRVSSMERAMRYSAAAYGPAFMQFLGLATKTSDPELFVLEQTGISAEDLLHADFSSEMSRPGYFLAVDHASQCLVVTIRGSSGVHDALTDLRCGYAAFILPNYSPEQQPPLNATIVSASSSSSSLSSLRSVSPPASSSSSSSSPHRFTAHKGMLESACWFDEQLRERLTAEFTARPTYSLMLCGHSLGAGVASLLAMRWSRYAAFNQSGGRPMNLHCFAFGPPATMSPSLHRLSRPWITSIVLAHDVVPRLSLGSVQDMVAMALVLTGRRPLLPASSSSSSSSSSSATSLPAPALTRAYSQPEPSSFHHHRAAASSPPPIGVITDTVITSTLQTMITRAAELRRLRLLRMIGTPMGDEETAIVAQLRYWHRTLQRNHMTAEKLWPAGAVFMLPKPMDHTTRNATPAMTPTSAAAMAAAVPPEAATPSIASFIAAATAAADATPAVPAGAAAPVVTSPMPESTTPPPPNRQRRSSSVSSRRGSMQLSEGADSLLDGLFPTPIAVSEIKTPNIVSSSASAMAAVSDSVVAVTSRRGSHSQTNGANGSNSGSNGGGAGGGSSSGGGLHRVHPAAMSRPAMERALIATDGDYYNTMVISARCVADHLPHRYYQLIISEHAAQRAVPSTSGGDSAAYRLSFPFTRNVTSSSIIDEAAIASIPSLTRTASYPLSSSTAAAAAAGHKRSAPSSSSAASSASPDEPSPLKSLLPFRLQTRL